MTLSAPRIRHVSGTRRFVATARWTFKNSPWTYDGCTLKVGGRDGFGITFSKDVVNLRESLKVCNVFGKCGSAGAALDDNNARGASYTYQDYADGNFDPDYTGVLRFTFKRLRKGWLQAFSKYAHTWSSTAVTGFGVGPYSFDISWSASTHRWTLASRAGRYGSC